MWKAYAQLQTYKDEISDLLAYKVALVISDGITARVGSLTANKERFMPWETIKNEGDRPLLEYQLEKVVRGFFDPELFLDYMRYFVLFEDDGDALIKKIAGYHQFHGVREAVRVTTIAADGSDDDAARSASAIRHRPDHIAQHQAVRYTASVKTPKPARRSIFLAQVRPGCARVSMATSRLLPLGSPYDAAATTAFLRRPTRGRRRVDGRLCKHGRHAPHAISTGNTRRRGAAGGRGSTDHARRRGRR